MITIYKNAEKNKSINQHYHFLFKKIANKNIVERFINEDGDECFRLKDPTGQGYNKSCPLHMPKAYMENPEFKKKPRSKSVDPEKKYKALADQAHRGHITDKCLKVSLKILRDSLSVFIKGKGGEYSAFESNANGTRRKSNQDRDKIALHARRCNVLHPHTLFLTLTQRVNPGKDDIISQYKFFGEQSSKFLMFLVKEWHCTYEVVSESTKNGYRHAHIVLHFAKMPDVAKIVKRKHSADVYGGKLREWIKLHWSLGTSKLEISKDRSPVTYLLKYVTKFAYSDMTKLVSEEKELNADERKGILTLILPILSRTRRFNLSQLSKSEIEEADRLLAQNGANKCTKLKISKLVFKSAKPDKISLLRPRRSLDSLCINSEPPCHSFIRIMGYKKFKKTSFGEIEEFKDLPEEFKAKIFNRAIPVGCRGCVYTHILNELKTGNDPWFHKDKFGGDILQVAEGRDFWQYTSEETEKREELLKTFDERVLPFVVDDMRLTFYKRSLMPKVKITFAPKTFAPIGENGREEDIYKNSWGVKIHKYLLRPKTHKIYEDKRIEYTEDMVKRPTAKIFYGNEISRVDYENYAKIEKNKLSNGF